MSVRSASFAPVLALAAAPATAGVLVVDAAGGGAYTQISAAVAAAQEGDTLLVRAGTYDGFAVDAKSLSVVADASATVLVRGSTFVRNLSSAQTVVLSGLDMGYLPAQLPAAGSSGAGILVTGVAGDVRLQGCVIRGKSWPGIGMVEGGVGLAVDANAGTVAAASCQILGGRAMRAPEFTHTDGVAGLAVGASRVALYDCAVVGGRGGDSTDGAGDGGYGVDVHGPAPAGLFAANTTITGGQGGDDWEGALEFLSAPGDGGDGLHVESDAAAQLLDCALAGGPVGVGVFCAPTVEIPQPGQPSSGAGPVFHFAGEHVRLDVPRVLRTGTSSTLAVHGEPGDEVCLWVTDATGFRVVPSWRGVVVPELPTPARTRILGTIPGSGVLTVEFPAPALGAGTAERDQFVQAFRRDAQGSITLGSFAVLTTVGAAY